MYFTIFRDIKANPEFPTQIGNLAILSCMCKGESGRVNGFNKKCSTVCNFTGFDCFGPNPQSCLTQGAPT